MASSAENGKKRTLLNFFTKTAKPSKIARSMPDDDQQPKEADPAGNISSLSGGPKPVELCQNPGTEHVMEVGTSEREVASEKQVAGCEQSGASAEQKARADLNRTIAMGKLALKKATAEVETARASGSQPQLEQLLIESGWRAALSDEMKKPYFTELQSFVHSQWSGSNPIYPPAPMVFRAFNTCPINRIRVVIIGQDPYHGPNQAMGLCFSVPRGEKIPSSLQNIFKELNTDLGCTRPQHGDLDKWATQGVFLLNTVLTVRAANANSHAKKGWEKFTDAVIKMTSDKSEPLVFLLWGKPAQEKERLINTKKHCVLKCPHPSGLSAHRGFYGCKHFSKANEFIKARGEAPIDWQL